ncbi:hypothetical protein GCM10009665_11810 [Kitasatospora nipponensis]|uniref:RDD family protein n=1 Tax=Kitasatospora nipponensis TaxID=258049 RepID=A0ABN1VU65_9ACTN
MPIPQNTAPLPTPDGNSTTSARLARWRTRSRLCAAIDLVAGAGGAALLLLAAVDSLVSWPSNRVLLTHGNLAGIAGAILLPFWLWLIASFALVMGGKSRSLGREERAAYRAAQKQIWRAMFPHRRVRIGLGTVALLCLAVVVGGFAVGGSNGSARVLPGPRYQVSVPDLDHSDWTDVPHEQYARWQGEFVRADGLFTFFGLFLAGGSLGLRQLHRRSPR